MAYKDEYEVARLHADPAFAARLADTFAGKPKLSYNLAPPLLPLGKDPRTGRPRKIELGGWMLGVFKALRHGKRLRGTWLDPFGHTAERRLERALIGEYEALIRSLADAMTPEKLAVAAQIAAAPALVAGYGPVKEAGVAAYRARVEELLAAFRLESAARDVRTAPEIA